MTSWNVSTVERRDVVRPESENSIDVEGPPLDMAESGGILSVLARPLPLGGEEEITAIADEIGRRSAIYLSAPITTGREFLRWLRQDRRDDPSRPDDSRRPRGEVIEENRRALVPLKERLARVFPDSIVIDPTRLDMPDWDQKDYHRFWVEVLRRLARSAVFADGWEYSTGCTIEYAMAVSLGLKIFDCNLEPIDTVAGLKMIRSASQEIEAAGLDTTLLISAARHVDAHGAP
jgi:hypothetical protein